MLYLVLPPMTTGIQPPNRLQVQHGPLVSVGDVIGVLWLGRVARAGARRDNLHRRSSGMGA
jgi:hypothetical protein